MAAASPIQSYDLAPDGTLQLHDGPSTHVLNPGASKPITVDSFIRQFTESLSTSSKTVPHRSDRYGDIYVKKIGVKFIGIKLIKHAIAYKNVHDEIATHVRAAAAGFAPPLIAAQIMPTMACLLFELPEGDVFATRIIATFTPRSLLSPLKSEEIARVKGGIRTAVDALREMGITHITDTDTTNVWLPMDASLPPVFLDFGRRQKTGPDGEIIDLAPEIFSDFTLEDGNLVGRNNPSTFCLTPGSESDCLTLGDLAGTKVFAKEVVPFKKIGEGVSGKVFKIDTPTGSYVLKSIRKAGTNNAMNYYLKAMNREIKMLLKVSGKTFAVELLAAQIMQQRVDSKLVDYTAFMLFPYIEGQDLINFANDKWRKPGTAERFEKIHRDLVKGLIEMHGMGIYHMDVKPDNIWIPSDESISPFFLDFGMSAEEGEKINWDVGTPDYTRPKITSGNADKFPAPNDDYYAFSQYLDMLRTNIVTTNSSGATYSLKNLMKTEGVTNADVMATLDKINSAKTVPVSDMLNSAGAGTSATGGGSRKTLKGGRKTLKGGRKALKGSRKVLKDGRKALKGSRKTMKRFRKTVRA